MTLSLSENCCNPLGDAPNCSLIDQFVFAGYHICTDLSFLSIHIHVPISFVCKILHYPFVYDSFFHLLLREKNYKAEIYCVVI
jgi:hypothetical protein